MIKISNFRYYIVHHRKDIYAAQSTFETHVIANRQVLSVFHFQYNVSSINPPSKHLLVQSQHKKY